VDFGLAVDLAKWRGPGASPDSWQLADIGGDCRYWPVAAWLQFECGYQELTKYPDLANEYQTHLDMHALGITALQVWGCMVEGEDADQIPEEVIQLHAAWEKYWQDATCVWERMQDCFHNSGDQNSLKGWILSQGVHNIIGHDLANIRTALREVCQVCGASSSLGAAGAGGSSMLSGQRPLFAMLLELISAGGVAGFVRAQKRTPSWQGVLCLLDENSQMYQASPGVAATTQGLSPSQPGLTRPAPVRNPKPASPIVAAISAAQLKANFLAGNGFDPFVLSSTFKAVPGQLGEYYSDSKQNWFACKVIDYDKDGGLKVDINGNVRTVPKEKLPTSFRPLSNVGSFDPFDSFDPYGSCVQGN